MTRPWIWPITRPRKRGINLTLTLETANHVTLQPGNQAAPAFPAPGEWVVLDTTPQSPCRPARGWTPCIPAAAEPGALAGIAPIVQTCCQAALPRRSSGPTPPAPGLSPSQPALLTR